MTLIRTSNFVIFSIVHRHGEALLETLRLQSVIMLWHQHFLLCVCVDNSWEEFPCQVHSRKKEFEASHIFVGFFVVHPFNGGKIWWMPWNHVSCMFSLSLHLLCGEISNYYRTQLTIDWPRLYVRCYLQHFSYISAIFLYAKYISAKSISIPHVVHSTEAFAGLLCNWFYICLKYWSNHFFYWSKLICLRYISHFTKELSYLTGITMLP